MVQQCQPGFRFDESAKRCVRERTTSAASGVQSRQKTAQRSRGQRGGTQVEKQTAGQRKASQEAETANRSTRLQFGGQNRQEESFQDIASQTVGSERQRLADPSGRFKDLPQTTSFDFGGKIFSVDEQGQLVPTGLLGKTQEGSKEIIGINDQGRRTNLGKTTTTRINPETGKLELTAGRAPIGTFQRESGGQGQGTIGPGQRKLFTAEARGGRSQETITDVSDLEISGEEKAQKLRAAGLLGGGRGATKTLAQIGDMDFAKQLGFFNTNPPKGSPGEDPRDTAVRVATWKVDNMKKAYNASMQNWEQQKVAQSLQRQQEAFEKPGFQFKSKSQIRNEMENDNDMLTAFNAATSAFTSSRKAQTDANIKKRTSRLGSSSEKSRDLATRAIEAEERQNEKEDLARGLAELETQKAERIDSLVEQQASAEGSLQAEIKRKEGLTFTERAKEEKDDFIEFKAEALIEADPSLTLNAAIAKAKKIFKGDDGKPPTVKEVNTELDDIVLAPDFDNATGYEVALAAHGGDSDEAEDYLESRLFPESTIISQRKELQLARGFSEEQIAEKAKDRTFNKKLQSALAGEASEEELLDLHDEIQVLETENPKKAARIQFKLENPDATPSEIVANEQRLFPTKAEKKKSSPKTEKSNISKLSELGKDALDDLDNISVDNLRTGDNDLGESLGISIKDRNLLRAIKREREDNAPEEDEGIFIDGEFFEKGTPGFEAASAKTSTSVVEGKTVDDFTDEQLNNLSEDELDVVLKNSE